MNSVCRDIFQAIHEGKWLSIEYRNVQDQVTKYWIGIRDLWPGSRTLSVEGFHLGKRCLEQFDRIYIDSILSSQVLDGTYCPVNQRLTEDIALNPEKYRTLFDHGANLKILNYLEDCNRMDTTPYKLDFALVRRLDRESFHGGRYDLDEEQFGAIVRDFQLKAERKKEETDTGRVTIQRLAMNVLSLHTAKGLYVLAYRRLNLDVKQRCLRPEDGVTVCMEFTIDGAKESIRRFLDGGDYELLRDFEGNQERIKDALSKMAARGQAVDDLPYIIGLGIDIPLDLHREYSGILEMYQRGEVTVPVKAFFGDLLDRPRGGRPAPMALRDRRVNLDQLLAIHNGMKYPVAYIQGPPGTGKTETIVNTVITAFFNERTVLFSSYNNHPIDEVVKKLEGLTYRGKPILLPVVRLGNQEKLKEALKRMKALHQQASAVKVYASTLERNKEEQAERAKRLSALLKRYEDVLELREREETIRRLLEYQRGHGGSMQMLNFEADLGGRQLAQVQGKLKNEGEISEEDALALLDEDKEELKKYLFYISAKYLQRLDEPKNDRLKAILYGEDPDKQAEEFQTYLGEGENLKNFLRIFPLVATTCISAHRLGRPAPQFDMVIMDEASQCNTAVSLVPILRGRRLMLVGDPQQLNPVILLDEGTNRKLRQKYGISDEYDYRKNSIYKTYLSCDSVSDEVLLRRHYRCARRIIDFNNRKYYNSRLLVCTEEKEGRPLQYIDVSDSRAYRKNTAPGEAEAIIRYARQNRDRSIGVITPFVNQKEAIEARLKEEGLNHVSCGTVHAFQGDEKDVVLFSTALTDETYEGTYQWLKNNRELINVAVSRAKDRLVVLSSLKNLERLHKEGEADDLYDLIRYVRANGQSEVTPRETDSRALGVKPFSTATEEAFLATLTHALDNIWLTQSRFSVEKEVAISQVFKESDVHRDLFYSGRFDFVVYERHGERKFPVLAIELDGMEHCENEVVRRRDQKKQEICSRHGLQLIRVENSYARRYQHIKGILTAYFAVRH